MYEVEDSEASPASDDGETSEMESTVNLFDSNDGLGKGEDAKVGDGVGKVTVRERR